MRWFLVLLFLAGLGLASWWGWDYYRHLEHDSATQVLNPWVTVVVSGNSLLVDSDGVFLSPFSVGEENVARIIVTGLSSSVAVGDRLTKDSVTALHSIIDPILLTFPDYEWRLEVGELRKLGLTPYFVDVTLLQNDSLPIRIGEGRFVTDKITVLSKLLQKEVDIFTQVAYIDLRVRQKAYVKAK